jgi:hypothetical protein
MLWASGLYHCVGGANIFEKHTASIFKSEKNWKVVRFYGRGVGLRNGSWRKGVASHIQGWWRRHGLLLTVDTEGCTCCRTRALFEHWPEQKSIKAQRTRVAYQNQVWGRRNEAFDSHIGTVGAEKGTFLRFRLFCHHKSDFGHYSHIWVHVVCSFMQVILDYPSHCVCVYTTVSNLCRQIQQITLFLNFISVLQHVSVIRGDPHQVKIHNCKGKEVLRWSSGLTLLFLYSCVFLPDDGCLLWLKPVIRQ